MTTCAHTHIPPYEHLRWRCTGKYVLTWLNKEISNNHMIIASGNVLWQCADSYESIYCGICSPE